MIYSIFTLDISKAGKRPTFISRADFFKLLFVTLII